MNTLTKADVLSLSVPERIHLVEDIWDSIAQAPDVGSTRSFRVKVEDDLVWIALG